MAIMINEWRGNASDTSFLIILPLYQTKGMVSMVSLPECYSRNTATTSTVNTWSFFFQANRNPKTLNR